MALARRTGQRLQSAIWPGFVDAMTGLLLVLIFVLTIFMFVQFVLRETISGQQNRLSGLTSEIAALTETLGLERERTSDLELEVDRLSVTLRQAEADLSEQAERIAGLLQQRTEQDQALRDAQTQITDFEAQVAALLATEAQNRASIAELETDREQLRSGQEALNLALAQARTEMDAQLEAARLAAARREALEALVADLGRQNADAQDRITDLETELSQEEAARLADAAAAEILRSRLADASAELTSMTLALEEQRAYAEETLTLLAAVEATRDDLNQKLIAALSRVEGVEEQLVEQTALRALIDAARQRASDLEVNLSDTEAERAALKLQVQTLLEQEQILLEQLDETKADEESLQQQLLEALAAQRSAESKLGEELSRSEQRAVLLASAQRALAEEEEISAEGRRQLAVLNQQISVLREQLGQLQGLLDDSQARDAASSIQIESLGRKLNAALARAVSEQARRRQLEEAERRRLEEEARRLADEKQNLESYRSEFFGRMREVLAGQDRVRVIGDRFVFSSEVLFAPARADLSPEGATEISSITRVLNDIIDEIPTDINWVIQVDGHTDDRPLTSQRQFSDNWELSQARALSVVRYMVEELAFPPDRLSANGFGPFQPVNADNSDFARAQNRRIELKLTEK
ncbi:MAG: peptidoglycan -binding protein [Aestuariivita sp.]|nr:peptidoglycan -binding protein [Aestuariivita sp.]